MNARKCEFVQQRSVILGHVVSKEGISTDPDKVKVLEKWPIPNNLSDLRLFLGCTGYYRQYIRDYARIAEPLYRLERKGTVFKWNDDCQKAFNILKTNLTTAPILSYPRLDISFILDTDACDTGIGAVLKKTKRLLPMPQGPYQKRKGTIVLLRKNYWLLYGRWNISHPI